MNGATTRDAFKDLEERALHHTRVAGSLIRKLLVAYNATYLDLLAHHVEELRKLRQELGSCYIARSTT